MENLSSLERTLRREIDLARKIQSHLLNGKVPTIAKGEVTGISLPARVVGGDYFDFYPLPNGNLRIVIGDVMGKGIPAAMLMILTRGAFRSAAESTSGPGETITAMNNALIDDLRLLGSFVTLFCAEWNPNTGIMTHANAGHHQPIIIREKKLLQDMPRSEGVMLGGLPRQIYKEEVVKLNQDDSVFFYTDGIIEAYNKNSEQYKIERLLRLLQQHCDNSVVEIRDRVLSSIQEFTEDLPQKDDITMVVLKINGV